MLDMETPLQIATQLQHATVNFQQLVENLKASLWEKATVQERRLPNNVQPQQPEESPLVVPVANWPTTYYTPAFLNNKAGVLDPVTGLNVNRVHRYTSLTKYDVM